MHGVRPSICFDIVVQLVIVIPDKISLPLKGSDRTFSVEGFSHKTQQRTLSHTFNPGCLSEGLDGTIVETNNQI